MPVSPGWHRAIFRDLEQGLARGEDFRLLFNLYYPRVYASFPKGRVSPADRKDLTQEVFLRVYKGWSGHPSEREAFERWLYRIARNTFLSWMEERARLKRRGANIPLSDEAEAVEKRLPSPGEPSHENALDLLLEDERARLLYAAVDDLPPQMRNCILLRVTRDLSDREIAAALRLSVGAVKAHLSLARQRLRSALAGYFNPLDFERVPDE